MFTLGVDLGKNGGFCLLNPKGEIEMMMAMPRNKDDGIDHYEIEAFFDRVKSVVNGPIVLSYEKVGGRGGNSASSMYSFGRNNGYVQALMHSAFHRNILEVLPRTWQKWLFNDQKIKEYKNAKNKRDTKRMAIEAIQRLFPSEDFRRNTRCKNAHDGIVDSVGIAYYTQKEL